MPFECAIYTSLYWKIGRLILKGKTEIKHTMFRYYLCVFFFVKKKIFRKHRVEDNIFLMVLCCIICMWKFSICIIINIRRYTNFSWDLMSKNHNTIATYLHTITTHKKNNKKPLSVAKVEAMTQVAHTKKNTHNKETNKEIFYISSHTSSPFIFSSIYSFIQTRWSKHI